MESVLLIVPRTYKVDFIAKIALLFKVSKRAGGGTVVDNSADRIYIYRSDSIRNELERDEWDRIASKISDPR